MDALAALKTRVSCAKVRAPAPSQQQLDEIESSALRAADHGKLRPWRYLRIQGEGLARLGEVFAKAALDQDPDLTEAQQQRFKNMPLRAPYIYIAICRVQQNPKVPRDEQMMAAACSVQNMITAAFALGVGAYWRSGVMAWDKNVKKALNLAANEEIIGFIYLGTPVLDSRPATELQVADFFEDWG